MIIFDIFAPVNLFSMQLMIFATFVIRRFMITDAQCRAGRGLLNWSQQALAEAAGVGVVTIRQIEGGQTQPRRATLQAVRLAMEHAGIEFIPENGGGPGVRLRARQRTD